MTDTTIGTALAEQLNRVLSVRCDRQLIDAANAGTFPADLWGELDALQLSAAMRSAEGGGFGLGWNSLHDVYATLGYWACPVPLGDTLVANWFLDAAGMDAVRGPVDVEGRVVPAVKPSDRHRIAIVRESGAPDHIVLTDGTAAACVAPACDGLAAGELVPAAALLRAAQISGGLARILDLSVAYASERKQFGQPIARFQGVQALLASLATEAAAASAASRLACRLFDDRPVLAAAIAKSRCSRAATAGVAAAHQIHGAIGVTGEHILGAVTAKLLSWREDAGNEFEWSAILGQMLVENDQGLWSTLVGWTGSLRDPQREFEQS